jgi:hypothetical protein
MELPDTDLKIDVPGKGRHFQKDLFYRLVIFLRAMETEIQRICVKAKPAESNRVFYEWQTASIVMFIPEIDKSLAIHKARSELSRRQWEFIEYEDKSTLIEERLQESGGEVWEAYQYAKGGNIFFHIFPDHFDAGKSGIKPICPGRITENFIDSVIEESGGRRLGEKEKKPGFRNADYIIGDFIFELKDTQEEGLEKLAHQNKLAELFQPYFPGRSEISIDPSVLSKPDYLKYLDIISKPIKTHIRSASKQIKETRALLECPDLKGGIILINTGFGSFPHDEFAKQVERFASKDSSQFDAVITVSTWFYTNGFDSYMFHKFSPKDSIYPEVERIRQSFDILMEQMMTDLVKGNLPESTEFSDPIGPVTFSRKEIDFNWKPPTIPLPWDKDQGKK